jgi:hypothetical protein
MKREAIVGASGNAVVSACDEKGEGMKWNVGDGRQSGMSAMSDKGMLYFSLMELGEMPEKAGFDWEALN